MPRQTIMLTPQSCDLFQRPFFQFAQIGSLVLYIRHKARAQIMREQQTEPH